MKTKLVLVYEYKVGSTLDNQYNSPCSHNKGEENHMSNSINAESVIDKRAIPNHIKNS